MSDIQRSRLVGAMVVVVDELGYSGASVSHITGRARVSRRTFYELFADRDDCFAALLDEIAAQVERQLFAAGVERLSWRERLQVGLWVILSFLEQESALARVCVVQTLAAGPTIQERRQQVVGRLVAEVDRGRLQGARGAACSALLAEGLVGAAVAIVHARLSRGEDELTGVFGELLELLLLPYLGPAAARRERGRPAPVLERLAEVEPEQPQPQGVDDPLRGLSMRLTYRTLRVLQAAGELLGEEGYPSNRQVAQRAGITDPGQISKLLRRLQGLGLLCNVEERHGKGSPNAWALTPKGQAVVQSIRSHTAAADRWAA
jgi:AcrR family transcriptional regulator